MNLHLKITNRILFFSVFLIAILFNRCNQENAAELHRMDIPIIYDESSDVALHNRIHNFFQDRHNKSIFNGVALFAKDGKIVYHEAFGFSRFPEKDSLDRNGPFQLASVSKPITSIAILQLYEKGLLDLDDSVQRFIPKFPYQGITIRHLLSHRSGLPNYMYFIDEVWPDQFESASNDDVLNIMQVDTPARYYMPDKKYNYSNTNYAILASIVERITKKPFEVYMLQNIFTPVGMDSTFIYNRNKTPKLPQTVIGYNGAYNPKNNHYQNGVMGDKGVYASAVDLFRLDIALRNEKLLSDSTLAIAYSPHNPDLERRNRDNYGLGWRIQKDLTHGRVVYHNGWWKGFKTYYIRLLDKNQTIIVLTNVTRGRYLNRKALIEMMN